MPDGPSGVERLLREGIVAGARAAGPGCQPGRGQRAGLAVGQRRGGDLSGRPRIWCEFFSELLSMVPFCLGILVRRMFWERTLPSCGHKLCVHFGALLSFAGATIGNNVLINRYTFVGLLDIVHNVMIANQCTLLGGRYQHRADQAGVAMREQGLESRHIRIGEHVWIGADRVIMADAAEGNIVGAGAVVLDDVPRYSVAVAIPACAVGRRRYEICAWSEQSG